MTIIPPASSLNYDIKKKAFKLRIDWMGKFKSIGKLFRVTAITCIIAVGLLGVNSDEIKSAEMDLLLLPEAIFTRYIIDSNPKVNMNDAVTMSNSILKWADQFNIDPSLLLALSQTESGFNKHSISSVGAVGLTQIMVRYHVEKIKTAKKYLPTPELFDINTNIYLGAWVLRDCLTKFKSTNSALLCYNGSNSNPSGYDKVVLRFKSNIDGYLKSVKA
jgi:soluble lytic murein transglycosylase-like protein